MKIGFYGGIANNMYVFAKAFARLGHNVTFIRDRGGRFAFSQPMWDDVRLTLPYDDAATSNQWQWEDWTRLERESGWQPPAWLVDPFSHAGRAPLSVSGVWSSIDTALLERVAHGQQHWAAAVDLMRQCDVLLVCGIESEILALASGRPFGIWTHGGDLRTAAGFHRPQTRDWPTWRYYLMQQRLLRLAFKRSLFIGSYDPRGFGGHVGRIPARFEIVQCPIPVGVHARLDRHARRQLLAEVLASLGHPSPQADVVLFVPSRVDFYWKGMDRLMRAIARVADPAALHIIVSGWGRDYEAARQMVPEASVTFLPCALSRPVLNDFFKSVDLVADQFLLGTYGTGAVEAMGFGVPVMMWFDEAPLRERGWEPPPVINAHTEPEIESALRQVISGAIDLDARSIHTHDWIRRVHGEHAVEPMLINRLQES